VYVPAAFAQPDVGKLHDFIDRHSFALLCSAGADGTPFASHLPLLLDRGAGPRGTLKGHMARANPQWRYADGQSVLAVFSGPHAYVSPAWYEAEDVVPTWNYLAVHVTGTLRAVHEPAEILGLVREAVAYFEGPRPAPWMLGGSPGYLERMARGVVGFRIEIGEIEGKWKLGQNHPPERRAKVARALLAEGGPDAEAIARLVEETLG
jgi:transcriptional regulator